MTNDGPKKKSSCMLIAGLTACGLVFAVLVCGGIFGLVFSTLRNSDAGQVALEAARANPEVIDALGEPIEMGWLVMGSIRTENGRKYADIQVPVHGPKGKGTIWVEGEKLRGQWDFSRFEIEIGGRYVPLEPYAGEEY